MNNIYYVSLNIVKSICNASISCRRIQITVFIFSVLFIIPGQRLFRPSPFASCSPTISGYIFNNSAIGRNL